MRVTPSGVKSATQNARSLHGGAKVQSSDTPRQFKLIESYTSSVSPHSHIPKNSTALKKYRAVIYLSVDQTKQLSQNSELNGQHPVISGK